MSGSPKTSTVSTMADSLDKSLTTQLPSTRMNVTQCTDHAVETLNASSDDMCFAARGTLTARKHCLQVHMYCFLFSHNQGVTPVHHAARDTKLAARTDCRQVRVPLSCPD